MFTFFLKVGIPNFLFVGNINDFFDRNYLSNISKTIDRFKDTFIALLYATFAIVILDMMTEK